MLVLLTQPYRHRIVVQADTFNHMVDGGTTTDIHNNVLLYGTPDFIDEEDEVQYQIRLEYQSGYTFYEVFDVFVNSYVDTNDWSKDFAYNLNYDIDARDIFAPEILSISKNKIDGVYQHRMRYTNLIINHLILLMLTAIL